MARPPRCWRRRAGRDLIVTAGRRQPCKTLLGKAGRRALPEAGLDRNVAQVKLDTRLFHVVQNHQGQNQEDADYFAPHDFAEVVC
jgi:hypothetical protein